MNRFAGRDGYVWRERVGQCGVQYRGHDAQMFPHVFIVGDVKIVELRDVVVAGETGELLKMFGLEFDDGGSGKAMRLLTARDEGLPKEAANRFAPEEAKMAGTSGQAEKFFRIGRAQPLKIQRKLRAGEIFAHWRWWERMKRQLRRGSFESRNALSVERSKPPIF